jgi:hypothetical protein
MIIASADRRLTAEEARAKSAECFDLADRAHAPEHRVMLEHMAETWGRIALAQMLERTH